MISVTTRRSWSLRGHAGPRSPSLAPRLGWDGDGRNGERQDGATERIDLAVGDQEPVVGLAQRRGVEERLVREGVAHPSALVTRLQVHPRDPAARDGVEGGAVAGEAVAVLQRNVEGDLPR